MQSTYETVTISQDLALRQNRVLRNTYLLLALSMLPTVLGAFVGVQIHFAPMTGSPLMGALLFLGIAWGFMFAIEKTKDSAWGVVLLLAFTFFMGMMLSGILQFAL